MTVPFSLTAGGYSGDLVEAVTNDPRESRCCTNACHLIAALQAWALGCFSILFNPSSPVGPCSLPFSIYKFGNAELSPAGGIGTLDRRVIGDVIAHVLHQLFQLGACKKKGSETWGLIPG